MKSSARNQFTGKVSSVIPGPVNAEVELTLASGDRIVSVVTMGSAKDLGLAVGTEATALIKAPWVILMTDESGLKTSARNHLRGAVSRLVKGAVNTEVTMQTAGGLTVNAIITNESADSLGLDIGTAVSAIIKASHVILATQA
ncbi:transporter [Parasulfuritortus cantonensis]|uniref:Transporter n=1 Tax=Parasulfuritortus cantonensis TaxID=2528202 RepID=A0A4R1B7G9_9PROT|nr:TOBE domain-containing protein [Parasulfuritortus cantonensis]TCJ11569.1 transporter [Parasulfuritortus cantonensis]